MKTVNINLIGNLAKRPKKKKTIIVKRKDNVQPQIKLFSIIIMAVTCFILIISIFGWFSLVNLTKTANSELIELNNENESLQIDINKLNVAYKNLKNEKRALDFKKQAVERIAFIPWHNILTDISKAVPENIKISEINKTHKNRGVKKGNVLNIKGKIKTSKDTHLSAISYFIVNINEHLPEGTYLQDATIKELKYQDQKNIYNFMIEASIKSSNKTSNVKK